MKKIIFLLIGALLTGTFAQAQINWGDYSQSYQARATGKSPTVGLVLALRKGNDFLWSIRKTSDHFYALEKDSTFRSNRFNNNLLQVG